MNRSTTSSSPTPRSGPAPYVALPSPPTPAKARELTTELAYPQLNTAIGGDDDSIYLVIGDMGSKSGEGLDFINGYSWLERFYHVYVPQRNSVGFANTQYTQSEVN